MKKIILILVLFGTVPVFAQKGIVITNQILNKESKEPLAFAHIFIKNLSTGTYTDDNGYFTLIIPKSSINDTLTISCIGYKMLNLSKYNTV